VVFEHNTLKNILGDSGQLVNTKENSPECNE